MARFDLTDFEWSVIEPLLPTKVRGKARVDDRVLNGIFWRLRTGAPWADIPARYGPYTTCVPLQPMAPCGALGTYSQRNIRSLRWRYPDDRQLFDPRSPACGQRSKKKRKDPVAWVARVVD
ncbi:putative IS5 family transposase, IS427 group, OrfA [Rhizobium tropici CIAT 899]|nr:putative IS5 family transposase, IS427 group, OrfA [Rhizobium tropici CIAT 899]